MADDEMGEDADSLPEDLDVTALSGRYTFPDIRRRRIAGWLYVGVSAVCLLAWVAASARPVLVNRGVLLASLALLVFGSYHLATAWPLTVREVEALVAAARQVGFPVGHASAQLGWRGLRSRPTWRILLYSGEEPPTRRGLVLVDAVEGNVLSHFVEDNPEDWSAYDR